MSLEKLSAITIIRNIKGNSYEEKLDNINNMKLPYSLKTQIQSILKEIKYFVKIYENKNLSNSIRRDASSGVVEKYIINGQIDKIKIILKIYPNYIENVNSSDYIPYALISKSIRYDKYEITELLLDNGINLYSLVLFEAISVDNNYNFTDLLLYYGADPDQRNNDPDGDGETILHTACEDGFYDIVELLLYYGADPNIVDYNNQTPIMYTNNIRIKRLLLYYGADPNIAQAHHGETELMIASKNNNIELVELLLDNNADPNIKNKNGKTALVYAIDFDNNNIQILLNNYKYGNTLQKILAKNIASNIQGNSYEEKVKIVNNLNISNQFKTKTKIINSLKF